MPKKSQFQNLMLQQILQDYAQQPTTVQPALTLPIKPEALVPLPLSRPLPTTRTGTGAFDQQAFEPALLSPGMPAEMETPALSGALLQPIDIPPSPVRKKKNLIRGAALLLSALLMLAIGITWHSATPTSASPTITQQAYSSPASFPSPQIPRSPTATASDDNTIQVYIVGAIKRPGVYTLPGDARVYQLIKAAGGTQPNADLVSINLAARLTDGQEIYILSIGETPPIYIGSPANTGTSSSPTPTGALLNINTATESAMTQALHVSTTTAKKIIDYRAQHGAYTSVDQLLQVISQSIYDRIKNLVTV